MRARPANAPAPGDAAALVHEGRLAEAETAYRSLLERTPYDPVLLYNLGMLRLRRGDPADALTCFERCRGSGAVLAELGIGRALVALGRTTDAIATLKKAAHSHPDRADVQNALGVTLERNGDVTGAEAAYRSALAAQPTYGAAISNLYDLVGKEERAGEADAELEALLAKFPDDVAVMFKLAYVKAFLGQMDAAEALMQGVAERVPHFADAYLNLGTFAQWRHDAPGAIAHFQRALSLSSDPQQAAGNLAHAFLYAGRFAEGWRQYEYRPMGIFGGHRFDSGSEWNGRWDGRPLLRQTLLLHGEGGFGDVLQFARYVAPARQKVGEVVVWLERKYAALASLLRSLPGVDRVVDENIAVRADAHCSLSSLPFLLAENGRLSSAPMPYLFPAATLREAWNVRLQGDPNLRVGLAWRGGPGADRFFGSLVDRRRSISFERLEPLFGMEGVSWYNLQKGARADEWRHYEFAAAMIDYAPELTDFAETAALASVLDLVITVDTSVAHLAGGLGMEVWLLNRFDSCWRWEIDGTRTHWYPSMRLFRQRSFGDWRPPIEAVADALRDDVERLRGRRDGRGDIALRMRR